MEMQIQIFKPNEFWEKHTEITRQVVKEELSNLATQKPQEDLIVIDEVLKILHKKSKQCIYNYLDEGRLIGYTLEGERVPNTKDLSKKEKDGLYFLRSDIYKGLVKKVRRQSHD